MESESRTLLSKPNLKRMQSMYRTVLKSNRRYLPFYLLSMCDLAAGQDFRNARTHYSNTQFSDFLQR
jgi:hypothetical protein